MRKDSRASSIRTQTQVSVTAILNSMKVIQRPWAASSRCVTSAMQTRHNQLDLQACTRTRRATPNVGHCARSRPPLVASILITSRHSSLNHSPHEIRLPPRSSEPCMILLRAFWGSYNASTRLTSVRASAPAQKAQTCNLRLTRLSKTHSLESSWTSYLTWMRLRKSSRLANEARSH